MSRDDDSTDAVDRDVVVVGGGPTGSSAGIFTSRYGLDTLVFDRGKAALPRAARIENYPGFPAGIDIETFTALLGDHVEEAGCASVADTVESIGRAGGSTDDGFVVETVDGRAVTTRYVVAASWYDGEYLRPLVGDGAFEIHDHGEERHEHFDPEYPDADGRTPVEGLYVAAPAGERNAQAIVAAGQGAHVARTLLEDHRRARGYPDGVAEHYDWLRPESEFAGEWGDRERWREWFAGRIPDDPDVNDARLAEVRESYIDRAFETRLSDEEIERRRARSHDRLLEHIDDDRIRAYVDEIDGEATGDPAPNHAE